MLGRFGVEEGLAGKGAELGEEHSAGTSQGIQRVFGRDVAGAGDELELFQRVRRVGLEPALCDVAAGLSGGVRDLPCRECGG